MPMQHRGVVLRPSTEGFDSGGSTFGSIFVDETEPSLRYLFYTGAKDVRWSHSAIGLAVSNDFYHFSKMDRLNPIVEGSPGQFNLSESKTPVVLRSGGHYYMFFAGSSLRFRGRKIGLACADDPCGPWEVLRVVAKPESSWEGRSIDLGPSVVSVDETEFLLFYSNVNNRVPIDRLFPTHCRRRVGILKVRVLSRNSVEAYKYEGNPLGHLNGPKGSPSESLFCPGCLRRHQTYFMFPSMSTYSLGYPYPQCIGILSDCSPDFSNARSPSVLIDGSREKAAIIADAKGGIALDTACPVFTDNQVYLYYSVMDRGNGVWQTALSNIDMRFMNAQIAD